jgi:hypothetical protein
MTPDDAKVRDLEWQANVPPVVAAGRLFVRYGPLWAYDLRPASNGSREPSVPAPPGTAYWDLNFRGFCPGNRDLFVTLDVKEGAFVSGAAAAPSWNRATHWIERAEVKTVEDGLSGTLRVRLNSDGVVPPDRRPVLAQVWIDVKCVQGGLVGSYAGGLADGTLIDGHVTGR